MSLRGLPDWHHPLEGGAGYAAYEVPGLRFAPPIALAPAVAGGVHVDRYSQDRDGDTGVVHYGVHTLRWDAVTASDALGADRVALLPLTGGVVRLIGPDALRGPDPNLPVFGDAVPLDAAGLATFVATLTLDAPSTDLVIGSYRRGTALIGASAMLVARGVAARHPSVVEIDVEELAAAFDADAVDLDALADLLADDPARAGVRFTAGAPDDEPAGRAEAAAAIVDRVVARFGGSVLVDDPLIDPAPTRRITLSIPPDDVGTRLRWDLSLPLAADRFFPLASSPLAAADDGVVVVADHQPFALGTGWHRLSIGATVRAPWAGATLGYEAAVPPSPPLRMQSAEASAFFDVAPWATADLRLGVREPVVGSVTAVVLFDGSGDLLRGAPRPLDREAVILPTDAFPARFVAIDVGAALAGCAVVAEIVDDDGAVLTSARFEPARSSDDVTLVAPREPDGRIIVRATDPVGRVAASEPRAVAPLHVDAFLFPGTGSRLLRLTCRFDDHAPATVSIDLVAEGRETDAAAIVRRAFTRSHPTAEWSRFVDSPFAIGFRWRPGGSDAWSDAVTGDDWTFDATQTKETP